MEELDSQDNSYLSNGVCESSPDMAVATNELSVYNAAGYSRFARHERKIGFRLLAEHYHLIADLPFPVNVLDVGCGTGEVTRLLAHFANVKEVLAVDTSAEQLAVAETFSPDDRINYQIADIHDPYFIPTKQRDNYFDLCCAMSSLHWLIDLPKAINTMRRALKFGGFFLAHTLACFPHRFRILVQELRQSKRWAIYADIIEDNLRQTFTPEWWRSAEPEMFMGEMLEQLGFDVINLTLEDDAMIYSAKEIEGELAMMKSISAPVPDQEYGDFINFCTHVLRNNFEQVGDGYYKSSVKILVILARKMKN